MSGDSMWVSGHPGVPWPAWRRSVLVGVGGAAGASGRWLVGQTFSEPAPDTVGWPWATLLVNVVGCLLIGLAARRLDRSSSWWDTLVTGVLGGFTTMSAFAVELNDLADAGRTTMLVGYAAATMVGAVGATWLASPETDAEADR